jgi:hypothetical protein
MTHPMKYLPALLLFATLWAGQAAWAQSNGTQAPSPPPANPQAPANPPSQGWGLSISNFLSQDEMDMLFEYLRDSFIATMRNDPEGASMPPELAFKLEILKQRMLKEGDAAVRQLMQSMQEDMDRALQEYNQQLPQHPQPPAPPAQPQPTPGAPSRT